MQECRKNILNYIFRDYRDEFYTKVHGLTDARIDSLHNYMIDLLRSYFFFFTLNRPIKTRLCNPDDTLPPPFGRVMMFTGC